MQHIIWLVWHNLGEPMLTIAGILIIVYYVPYLITHAIHRAKLKAGSKLF